MKIKINSVGFAQSDKYAYSLKYLNAGMLLTVGGILLTAIGIYGVKHSSAWMVTSTPEQTEEIIKIFKAYDSLCS